MAVVAVEFYVLTVNLQKANIPHSTAENQCGLPAFKQSRRTIERPDHDTQQEEYIPAVIQENTLLISIDAIAVVPRERRAAEDKCDTIPLFTISLKDWQDGTQYVPIPRWPSCGNKSYGQSKKFAAVYLKSRWPRELRLKNLGLLAARLATSFSQLVYPLLVSRPENLWAYWKNESVTDLSRVVLESSSRSYFSYGGAKFGEISGITADANVGVLPQMYIQDFTLMSR
ncbi:hypothetical protein K438DRAFT_1761151 [Mycena galopus ATCC 62051]|nr:hypothetical protein K438DRAFT_1761151 [Mycena galopus ATCC 62051]